MNFILHKLNGRDNTSFITRASTQVESDDVPNNVRTMMDKPVRLTDNVTAEKRYSITRDYIDVRPNIGVNALGQISTRLVLGML